jgi:hypothetical protein
MTSLKNYILLKKSYDVRKIYDIFYNSSYVIVLHIDNIMNNHIDEIRKELKKLKIYSFLLNKDDFLSLKLVSVAKGPSLVFYSDIYFYNILEKNFKDKHFFFDVMFNKHVYPLSKKYLEYLNIFYKNSSFQIFFSIFFLLNYYRNIFFYNNLIKNYFYKSLFFFLLNFSFFNFFNFFIYKINYGNI